MSQLLRRCSCWKSCSSVSMLAQSTCAQQVATLLPLSICPIVLPALLLIMPHLSPVLTCNSYTRGTQWYPQSQKHTGSHENRGSHCLYGRWAHELGLHRCCHSHDSQVALMPGWVQESHKTAAYNWPPAPSQSQRWGGGVPTGGNQQSWADQLTRKRCGHPVLAGAGPS
jgi:hypothetical protein